MTGPPAASGQHIRLSPAEGIALSHGTYDLRARDGKVLCTVSRGRAEQGLATGTLELWRGPSGAYLRAADLSYPIDTRSSNVPRSPFASMRLDKPDLEQMQRRNPGRYKDRWRGSFAPGAGRGKGAVGRTGTDRVVHFGANN